MKPNNNTSTQHSIALSAFPSLLEEGIKAIIGRENNMALAWAAYDLNETFQNTKKSKPSLIAAYYHAKDGYNFQKLENLSRLIPEDTHLLTISPHYCHMHAFYCLKAGSTGYVSSNASASEISQALQATVKGEAFLQNDITKVLLKRGYSSKYSDDFVDVLSARELEVFEMSTYGFSAGQMGSQLGISSRTAESYLQAVRDKLSLKNAHELQLFAHEYFNHIQPRKGEALRDKLPVLRIEDRAEKAPSLVGRERSRRIIPQESAR